MFLVSTIISLLSFHYFCSVFIFLSLIHPYLSLSISWFYEQYCAPNTFLAIQLPEKQITNRVCTLGLICTSRRRKTEKRRERQKDMQFREKEREIRTKQRGKKETEKQRVIKRANKENEKRRALKMVMCKQRVNFRSLRISKKLEIRIYVLTFLLAKTPW